MKNSSILLALGVPAALLSLWAGTRINSQAQGISGTGPCVIAAENGGRAEPVMQSAMVREVTAYNVGVADQTSDNPCIGASGKNLCRLVKRGQRVCAANFVALGTVLRIAHYGRCVVLDRMHRRFAHRVDIAMSEEAVDEAVAFGVQRRVVRVEN